MTYAFPGGIPNTQQWEFIPTKVNGDTSTRWIGDPGFRWDEVYSTDVNTTTATVGTLNVTTCNGCGSGGSMVYPAAGVANSTGTGWGTSYNVGLGANNIPQLNSSGYLPALNGSLLTSLDPGSLGTGAVASGVTVPWSQVTSQPAIPSQGAHLVSGTMAGSTSTITGTGSMLAIYSKSIPAGSLTVGTGVHCYARMHHTGSAAVTMQWTLGSSSQSYPTTFTGSTYEVMADIEILTPSSLSSQVVTLPFSFFGGTTESPQTVTWNENLANADTISINFNVAATDKMTGDAFYCQTVQ
jgi:hypothetical protein